MPFAAAVHAGGQVKFLCTREYRIHLEVTTNVLSSTTLEKYEITFHKSLIWFSQMAEGIPPYFQKSFMLFRL